MHWQHPARGASPWNAASPAATRGRRADGTVILQCTRPGGFAQLALVTSAAGKIWLADGVPAAFPVILRAVAQLSGGVKVAADAPLSPDIASYIAARAFSAGDISQYETLMRAGEQANLAGRTDVAESDYRAALALQEKQHKAETPAAAAAEMSLAMQLSNEGHFDDARAYFANTAKLLQQPGAADADSNGDARLALYMGVDALNQGNLKQAILHLRAAEAAFREKVPEAPDVSPGLTHRRQPFGVSSGLINLGDALGSSTAFATLAQREAKVGILEARRNIAIALRLSGDVDAAVRESRSAGLFAQANELTANLYSARVLRTSGLTAAADHRVADGVVDLDGSVQAFRAAEPLYRPTAEAELSLAALLNLEKRPQPALVQCRLAVALLRGSKEAVDFERMEPCLDVYAAASAEPGADQQGLLAEMFTASQLTRGSVTDQEIRRAAVRLGAGGNQAVSEAIRKQQDAENQLNSLLRARDALGATPADAAGVAAAADLDKQVADARTKLDDADGAVQAAAPNYQQLVQQAIAPQDVFAALRPREAFVAITLAASEGWTFALSDHRIMVTHIAGGTPRIADLVARVRASVLPDANGTLPSYDVAAARELYDAVLAGVATVLQNDELLAVAPTGPLLSVPFEILMTGPGDPADLSKAPFLVRRFTISHIPAAANFVKLRQAGASRAPRAWLGFGDFRPITQVQATATYPGDRCRESATELATLPPLAGTKRELDLVGKVFNAGAGDEVTGGAFTASAVHALPLVDYRIVHFATHALLPAEIACQDQPAIVTSAPDGAANANGALLGADQIAGLKMDADAVILSACNTAGGAGGTGKGESLAGLARSFFYAGARSLLVTHWEVDDQFATYIIGLSLGLLNQDPQRGLAATLREAQIRLLDRTDEPAAYKQPYYWAPFALVGEGGARKLVTAALN